MHAWPLALLPLATALVPFASIDCMRPWLDGQTHGVIEKQHGLLKPRLGTDADPITLGLMEADDVACVSSLIADAFGGGIEVIECVFYFFFGARCFLFCRISTEMFDLLISLDLRSARLRFATFLSRHSSMLGGGRRG